MEKRIVYGFGEAVYDIIFKENKILLGQPGGSVLNALADLAYRKCNSALISQISNDDLGEVIKTFLNKQCVKTEYLTPVKSKTKVALAFLDGNNNASYIFYNDRNEAKVQYKIPELTKNDVFLFGSSAAIDDNNRIFLDKLLTQASGKEALLFYDPNIRRSVTERYKDFRDVAKHYISCADIVRGSVDDFSELFGTRDPQHIYRQVKKLGSTVLIITDADKPVHLFSGHVNITIQFVPVDAYCTVGAGDAFNAGIISSLLDIGADRNSIGTITEIQWRKIINDSVLIASEVCKTLDNYLK